MESPLTFLGYPNPVRFHFGAGFAGGYDIRSKTRLQFTRLDSILELALPGGLPRRILYICIISGYAEDIRVPFNLLEQIVIVADDEDMIAQWT